MSLIDNLNTCTNAVAILATRPDTYENRATAAVLARYIDLDQPDQWEEPVMGLALGIVADAAVVLADAA